MADNDFIPGITDAGKPRAAPHVWPYPGHGSLEDVRLAREAQQATDRLWYIRNRKSWRTA